MQVCVCVCVCVCQSMWWDEEGGCVAPVSHGLMHAMRSMPSYGACCHELRQSTWHPGVQDSHASIYIYIYMNAHVTRQFAQQSFCSSAFSATVKLERL